MLAATKMMTKVFIMDYRTYDIFFFLVVTFPQFCSQIEVESYNLNSVILEITPCMK